MGHVITVLNLLRNCQGTPPPGGSVVKNLPYCAGDVGSIPGQGTGLPRAVEQLRGASQVLSLCASASLCPAAEVLRAAARA